MTKKELYTCDVCHTDFNTKEKAISCEKSHKAHEVKDLRFRANEQFPDKILLEFGDSSHTQIWYVRGAKKVGE